jgi:hypothetical protein
VSAITTVETGLRAELPSFGAPEESHGPVRNPRPCSRRFRAPLEGCRPASASRKQGAAEAVGSGQGTRAICFERQAFERRTRKILPLRFKPCDDVLRQFYRNLHGWASLLSIVSGATLFGHSASASSTGSCAKARYTQVPGFSAPGTGPSARACDRPPFRRERVSRAADFRGAGVAFPTDGIVTRSNSS